MSCACARRSHLLQSCYFVYFVYCLVTYLLYLYVLMSTAWSSSTAPALKTGSIRVRNCLNLSFCCILVRYVMCKQAVALNFKGTEGILGIWKNEQSGIKKDAL